MHKLTIMPILKARKAYTYSDLTQAYLKGRRNLIVLGSLRGVPHFCVHGTQRGGRARKIESALQFVKSISPKLALLIGGEPVLGQCQTPVSPISRPPRWPCG